MAHDQNGEVLTKSVRREPDGTWSALVWFGDYPATDICRYNYSTRKAARRASIVDAFPREGVKEWLGQL